MDPASAANSSRKEFYSFSFLAACAMTDTASIDEKAKRVRNLLSSYYVEESRTGDGTSQSFPRTPTLGQGSASMSRLQSIDASTFDATRYLSHVLRTMRLDDLLSKHQEMSTEIKTLDSDMQILVYENYNKFISATDTIRSMKSNVDGMETNMHELKNVIGLPSLLIQGSLQGSLGGMIICTGM